jgi:glc operon protein GlcG
MFASVLTRIRVALGVVVVLNVVALLAVGPGAQAQTAPVTITRQSLTLDAANAIITAAVAQANTIGAQEVIVIDDRDGFMIAMARMDNARLTSINIAMDKAYTAAVRQAATADLINNFRDNPAGMASFLAQPHMTLLGGGIPIMVDGGLVGGVGASGGTADQDIEVANAGLAALQH